jgi:subtilisin family serine protease/photosystem II stability/assembly factor-like uncharacterized protein
MRTLRRYVCSVLVLLPVIAGAAEHTHQNPANLDGIVPGVLIVKFRPGASPGQGALAKATGTLEGMLAQRGVLTLARTFPGVQAQDGVKASASRVDLSRIYYATVKNGGDVRAIARELALLREVEYAEPKYLQHLTESPNDPQFSTNQATYFSILNAQAGWAIAKGSPEVTIAVVDGGTYWQHEDLTGNLWINSAEDINHNGRFDQGPPPAGDEDGIDQDGDGFVDDVIGWNLANNTNNPRGLSTTPNSAAHGTATASHFGAVTNNGIGMAGSSWNCRLMPICAASPTSDESIAFGYEGIQFASSHGAQVINCSWGRLGVYSQFEHDVIAAATQAGSLVVAAAGNDSVNVDLQPEYPASFPEVFGIGATSSTSDAKAWFSNYGINISVYAPGTNIWSALDGGGYGNGGSGTSYSSPLVAGLAGIVKSLHPAWSPEQIRAQIRTSADSVDQANPAYVGNMGRGRANFARALSESHAGIEIQNVTIATPAGRDFFIPGDTAVVSLTVKNVLPQTATNLQVIVSPGDPAFQPLSGAVMLPSLAQNQEAMLPPLNLLVGTVTTNRSAVLAVRWVSNGNEWDARAYRVYLFTSFPRWLVQSTPAGAALFSVHAASRSVAWAAGGNGSGTAPTVVRTMDEGRTWANVTGSLAGIDIYTIFALDGARAWVGSGDGRIFATTDAGVTWTQQLYSGTQSPFIDGIWFFDADNGFALGDPAGTKNKYVILTTTNGGATWSHLSNEPVAGAGEAGWNNSFWWADPLHGWFGTSQFKVRGTSDGGATWFMGSTSSQNSVGVSFSDNLHGVVVFDDGHAQATTNGGVSWTSQSTPSPGALLTGVACAPGTNAVWTSDGLFMYRSRDAGQSWTAEPTYPFTGSVLHLSFSDSSHGWATTSFGAALRYQGDTILSSTPLPDVPQVFSLEQNYPNPFNPTTVIKYTIGGTRGWGLGVSDVKLVVYDVLGREVAVLVNERKAPGEYQVRFDGAGLASGVYFYRLTTNAFEATRKMLLIH